MADSRTGNRCPRCWHELQGLAAGASCPECGSAQPDAGDKNILAFAPLGYLKRLHRGALLLEIAGCFAIAMLLFRSANHVAYALLGRSILETFASPGLLDSIVYWSVVIVIWVIFVGPVILLAIGGWLMTAVNPLDDARDRRGMMQWAIRAGLVLYLVFEVHNTLALQVASRYSRFDEGFGRTIWSFLDATHAVAIFSMIAAVAIAYFAGIAYLRNLARRAGDGPLAAVITRRYWLILICAALYVASDFVFYRLLRFGVEDTDTAAYLTIAGQHTLLAGLVLWLWIPVFDRFRRLFRGPAAPSGAKSPADAAT